MFWVVIAVSAAVIVISMIATKRFFSSMLRSVLQGLIALFAVNFIGEFISVHLPVNYFTGAVSIIGGVPGVIFLLISDALL